MRDLNTGQWGCWGSLSWSGYKTEHPDVSVICPIGVRHVLENCPGPRTSLLVELSARNSLVVQCLGFRVFIAKGVGLIPGRRTEIPQGMWCGKKIKNGRELGATVQFWASLVAQMVMNLLGMPETRV